MQKCQLDIKKQIKGFKNPYERYYDIFEERKSKGVNMLVTDIEISLKKIKPKANKQFPMI